MPGWFSNETPGPIGSLGDWLNRGINVPWNLFTRGNVNDPRPITPLGQFGNWLDPGAAVPYNLFRYGQINSPGSPSQNQGSSQAQGPGQSQPPQQQSPALANIGTGPYNQSQPHPSQMGPFQPGQGPGQQTQRPQFQATPPAQLTPQAFGQQAQGFMSQAAQATPAAPFVSQGNAPSQWRQFLNATYGIPDEQPIGAILSDWHNQPAAGSLRPVQSNNPYVMRSAPEVGVGDFMNNALQRFGGAQQAATNQMSAAGNLGQAQARLGIDAAERFGYDDVPGTIERNAMMDALERQRLDPRVGAYGQSVNALIQQGQTTPQAIAGASQIANSIPGLTGQGGAPGGPAGTGAPGLSIQELDTMDAIFNAAARGPGSGIALSPTGQPNLATMQPAQLYPVMGNIVLQARAAGIPGQQILAYLNHKFTPAVVQTWRAGGMFGNYAGVAELNQSVGQ